MIKIKDNLPRWISEQFSDDNINYHTSESAWTTSDVVALCSGYDPYGDAWREECLTEDKLSPEEQQTILKRVIGAIELGAITGKQTANETYLDPESVTKWAEQRFKNFPFQSTESDLVAPQKPAKRTRKGDLVECLETIYQQLQTAQRPVNVSNVMDALKQSIEKGTTCVFEQAADCVLYQQNNGQTGKLTDEGLRTRIGRWKKKSQR